VKDKWHVTLLVPDLMVHAVYLAKVWPPWKVSKYKSLSCSYSSSCS